MMEKTGISFYECWLGSNIDFPTRTYPGLADTIEILIKNVLEIKEFFRDKLVYFSNSTLPNTASIASPIAFYNHFQKFIQTELKHVILKNSSLHPNHIFALLARQTEITKNYKYLCYDVPVNVEKDLKLDYFKLYDEVILIKDNENKDLLVLLHDKVKTIYIDNLQELIKLLD